MSCLRAQSSAHASGRLQEALDAAAKAGRVQVASLHVACSNAPAYVPRCKQDAEAQPHSLLCCRIALYTSLGFKTEAVLEQYYSSSEAAQKMTLELH